MAADGAQGRVSLSFTEGVGGATSGPGAIAWMQEGARRGSCEQGHVLDHMCERCGATGARMRGVRIVGRAAALAYERVALGAQGGWLSSET